ncbi:MAG TPA: hypothetical protein VF711_01175 [Acidimicrobiales bacterium]|jgi:hypothetical protein
MTDPDVRDRAESVSGWRYWQISGRSGHLRSVTQKRIEWPPGHVLVARCLGAGHQAPDPSCDCGIYGARDLDTLREHGLCLAPEVLIVGKVALWGRVIDDVSGWRAEFGAPAELHVVDDLVAGLDASEVAARLEAAYRVRAGTMPLADAVAGPSAAMLTFQAMSADASRSRSNDV